MKNSINKQLTAHGLPACRAGRQLCKAVNCLLLVVSLFGCGNMNLSSPSSSGGSSGGLASDTAAPTNTSIIISGGAASIESTSATMDLSAKDDVGVTGYFASETAATPEASASGWVTVTSTKEYNVSAIPFTLSGGNGTKEVYSWFKDAAGNISARTSDTIILVSSEAGGAGSWQTIQFGTSGEEKGQSIAIDSNNNIYITGFTEGELDGNNKGKADVFLIKYNSSGVKQWTRQIGTAGEDKGMGVAVDSSNNIYITGYCGSGLGSTSFGLNDIFLAKYDSSGNQQWLKQFGTSSNDQGSAIAVDLEGKIYITGKVMGDFGGNIFAGGEDVVLAKYDSDGNQIWAKTLATPGVDEGFGITTDINNYVYITGYVGATLEGNSYLGGSDIFLAKYDSSGNQQWVKQFGTSGNDGGRGIIVDQNSDVYVTGAVVGALDGNTFSGQADIFLAKYNSSGTKEWTVQIGTPGDNSGNSITINSSNLYVTGDTYDGLEGNASIGLMDIFVAKYSLEGSKEWVKQFGSSANDGGHGIVSDSSGNLFLTGFVDDSLQGNTFFGFRDFFIVKYDSNGNLK